MKTQKSYAKRLRVTKNGKIVARKPGQNHFNAKESRRAQLSKKGNGSFDMINHKNASRFLVNL